MFQKEWKVEMETLPVVKWYLALGYSGAALWYGNHDKSNHQGEYASTQSLYPILTVVPHPPNHYSSKLPTQKMVEDVPGFAVCFCVSVSLLSFLLSLFPAHITCIQ